jgi:dihydropteroate synthase
MHGATPPSVARQIATRVVAELLIDVDGLNADPFMAALQKASQSPFVTLATCPEIDTLTEFVERRVARLRARAGSYLTPVQQAEERSAIAADVEALLTGRYLRHLRSWE